MSRPPALIDVRMPARRFYDGGLPATADAPEVPPDRGRDARVVLERSATGGAERFVMLRRIGYDDVEHGELLVPAEIGDFSSDLTSVPWLFTWLVPKTGSHLPAALLHDGLVHADDQEPSYVSVRGQRIDRVAADRIFRDAMIDTGTPVLRSWLAWSAVTWWTMVQGSGTGWSLLQRWRHRLVAVLSTMLVAWLGLCGTLDLFDVTAVPGTTELPWMGRAPWWRELIGGAGAALAVPMLLGLGWGRFRAAGQILGVSFALLLHVSAVLLLLTGLYRALEALVSRWARRRPPGGWTRGL